ncbi:SDR family oxidoreductase [Hymenobacter psoromatis]|uniref:SDR family oxidoreductase n=1 Tax=Hymenobacter psoromatis TaxID=1484116 RepID=UPI001CBE7741|nr:SDR family oxidoreductase [Hymenobacter psoromatis]
MNRLQGKVAVITGGNSGIGFATAQEFIAEGARVVITGRNAPAVQQAVAQLGSSAVGIVSDAVSMTDLRQLAGQVQTHHARIDVLFANAGVSYAAPLVQVNEAHFDAQFDINVKGVYFTVQQLLPLFNDGGSIILNGSTTAHRAFPGISVYSATKAAVVALARNLSLELLDRRIRVNVLSPGPVDTPINHKMFTRLGMSPEAAQQAAASYAEVVPIKRVGQPKEIATVATFLASDDSSFVLGEEIIAGGGIATL